MGTWRNIKYSPHKKSKVQIPGMVQLSLSILSNYRCTHSKHLIEDIVQHNLPEWQTCRVGDAFYLISKWCW